jgi:NADPH:quinone reductase-like Zn-dependent oxidoreductase
MKPHFHALLFSAALLSASAAFAADTMQAIQYAERGPSSVLKLVELPKPQPKPDQVLVKVFAAGVNTIDWEVRVYDMADFGPALPVVPGFDFAGEIVSVGSHVSAFKAGQQVYAMLPLDTSGAYAQYVTANASVVAPAPKSIDAVAAAAMPLVALTAWQALFEAGQLKAGQTVLIHGAAGGVGHMAVQLAKNAGARVIGTASAGNLAFLRSIGADVAIDYRSQKFEDVVNDVDLVLDTVGGDTLARSYQVLRRGGTVVTLVGRIQRFKTWWYGVTGKSILVRPNAAQLVQIATLVDQGKLKPQIDTVYELRDAARANDKSESRHLQGRLVLKMPNTP